MVVKIHHLITLFMVCGSVMGQADVTKVPPVSDELRKRFDLSGFYKKSVVVEGFSIASSAKVRHEALLEGVWIVKSMLKNRSGILRALATNKVRLAVMAWNERTFNVPEHSDLKPHAFWNRRYLNHPAGGHSWEQPPNHPMKAPSITSPKKQIPSSQ